MNTPAYLSFDCQIYVARRGTMTLNLPIEAGPKKVASLEPISHAELVEPSFRRLLAAFESVPRPLVAQV
jgi:hypothetical protein